ncbi:hypothetical protein [Bradyrhizobium sp. AZCC 1610]|uniref:hypothetical protein n=1 Tax=Bradyrhizobium sp. AZCC 1610 TaxID=3117020 RepID=UPI002FF0D67C
MDNILEKIAAYRAAVSRYVKAGREFIATTFGKATVALLILVSVAAYAHHRGSVRAEGRLTPQIAELQKKLADAEARLPLVVEAAPDTNLADRLAASEDAKAKLQKKVADYETQLARRPAKAGAFTLSPADARSLSNIK